MSEDLNKLRELAEAATPGPWFWTEENGQAVALMASGGKWVADPQCDISDYGLRAFHWTDVSKEDAAFIAAFNPATALSLLSRLQAAEERAEKLEGAMLNVQQQCENVVFNLRQADSVSLSNKEAVTIFNRMATTLRVAALKTEGA